MRPKTVLQTIAAALCTLTLGAGLGRAQELSAADRQLARDIFQQLIETDTTHGSGSTTAAAERVRDRLLRAGFPAGDIEMVGPSAKRLNLVIRYRAAKQGGVAKSAGEKPVLFICHLDVVEAKRSDWTMDPFHFTEKDGFFYGRGTQDVKNSDAALVTSLLLLKRQGFVPKRDLIVALTADEEGGQNNGVAWLLKDRPTWSTPEWSSIRTPGRHAEGRQARGDGCGGRRKAVCRLSAGRDQCGRPQLTAAAGQSNL